MKLISKLSMLVVMMAMFAFTSIDPTSITGKYGDKESAKMEIIFAENGEFTYTDNSSEDSPLVVKGKWSAEKNIITLSEYDNADIPSKWRFDEKNKAVTTRKGATFYRMVESTKASCCSSKGKEKSCSDKKK